MTSRAPLARAISAFSGVETVAITWAPATHRGWARAQGTLVVHVPSEAHGIYMCTACHTQGRGAGGRQLYESAGVLRAMYCTLRQFDDQLNALLPLAALAALMTHECCTQTKKRPRGLHSATPGPLTALSGGQPQHAQPTTSSSHHCIAHPCRPTCSRCQLHDQLPRASCGCVDQHDVPCLDRVREVHQRVGGHALHMRMYMHTCCVGRGARGYGRGQALRGWGGTGWGSGPMGGGGWGVGAPASG